MRRGWSTADRHRGTGGGRDLAVQAADAILDELAERGIEARIHTLATQEDVIRAVAEGRHDCGALPRYGASTPSTSTAGQISRSATGPSTPASTATP